MQQTDPRPLVLHVMHRFDTGGLENGVVNLINHMPAQAYRHAVLALTEVSDFRQRIERSDVDFISLHKPPGQGVWQYLKLYQLFRQLRPQIVHSRNLAALEVQAPAWAAGVPVRIHGEHGRDMSDLDGANLTYQRVRRLYKPFVHHYMALSRDLNAYLVGKVRVAHNTITQVYNGVDTARFQPAAQGPLPISGCPFNPARHWLVGTVGRMQPVKDQVMLAHAFVQALTQAPQLHARLRLVMVGDGPLRAQAQAVLASAGMARLAWLPGERDDVADVLRGLHAFALPSRAEGICNSVLEAMASALPVVATAVGGNPLLVHPGFTGILVPPRAPELMAAAIADYCRIPEMGARHGARARSQVIARHSLPEMARNYLAVYDALTQQP